MLLQLAVLAADAGTVVAAAAPAVPGDPADTLKRVFDAVQGSNWKLVAAFIVLMLVQLVKTQGGKFVPALKEGWLAFLTALVLGAAGSVANGVAAGVSTPLFTMVVDGLQVGFLAAGGWSGLKALQERLKETKPVTSEELKESLEKLTDKK